MQKKNKILISFFFPTSGIKLPYSFTSLWYAGITTLWNIFVLPRLLLPGLPMREAPCQAAKTRKLSRVYLNATWPALFVCSTQACFVDIFSSLEDEIKVTMPDWHWLIYFKSFLVSLFVSVIYFKVNIWISLKSGEIV